MSKLVQRAIIQISKNSKLKKPTPILKSRPSTLTRPSTLLRPSKTPEGPVRPQSIKDVKQSQKEGAKPHSTLWEGIEEKLRSKQKEINAELAKQRSKEPAVQVSSGFKTNQEVIDAVTQDKKIKRAAKKKARIAALDAQEEDFLGRVTNLEWRSKGGRSLLRRAVDSGVSDSRGATTLQDVFAGTADSTQVMKTSTKRNMSQGNISINDRQHTAQELAVKVRAAEAKQGIDVARNREFYEHAERMGFKREKVDEFLGVMGYKPEDAYTVFRHQPGKGTPLVDDTGKVRVGKDNKPLVRTKGKRDEEIIFTHEDPVRNIITTKAKDGTEVRKERWDSFSKPEQLDKKIVTEQKFAKKAAERELKETERLARKQRNEEARLAAKVQDEVKIEAPPKKEGAKSEPKKEKVKEDKIMNFFNSKDFIQPEVGERMVTGALFGGFIGGVNAISRGHVPITGDDGSTWEFAKAVGVGALTGGSVSAASRPLMKKAFSEGGIGSGVMNMGTGFAKSNPDSVFADTARNLGGMRKYFVGPESGAAKAASALTKADRNLMYTGAGLTSGLTSSLSISDNKSRGLNSNRGNRF